MCSTAQPIYHHPSPIAVTPPSHADVTMHMTNPPSNTTHFDPLSSPSPTTRPLSSSMSANTSPRTPLTSTAEEFGNCLPSMTGNFCTSPDVDSGTRSMSDNDANTSSNNKNHSNNKITISHPSVNMVTSPHMHPPTRRGTVPLVHNVSNHAHPANGVPALDHSHSVSHHTTTAAETPSGAPNNTSMSSYPPTSWDATKEGPFWCRWHGCSLAPMSDAARFQSNSNRSDSSSSDATSNNAGTNTNNSSNSDDGKVFTDGHAIWQHILSVHLTPRPRRGHAFTCRWVNCTFTSLTGAYGAEMHLRGHLDWHPYCCKMCGVRFKRRGDYAKHMREKHSMRPGRDSQSPEPISPPVSGVNNGTSFDMMMMTSTSSSPDDTLRDIPGHRPLSPSSLRRVSLDSGYSSYYTSSMGMANANMHRSREPRRSFDYAPSVMTRPMSAIGHRYQHPYHHSPQHAHHHGQHHPHHYPYHPHHSTGHEMGPADSDSLHRHVMSMDQKHRPAAIAAIIENNGSHGPLSASSSPHYPLAPSHRELPPVRTGSPLEMRDRCASSSILISRPASTNGRDPFLPPLQPHSASQDRFFSSNNYHGVSSPLRPPSVPLPPHLAMPMSASAMGPEPASAHRYNNGYADYGPSGAPPVSWERSRWSPPLRPLSTPAGPSPQQMARPSISSPLTSTLPSFPEARLGQTPMQRHQSSAAVMQKHAHAKEEEHSYYPNEYPSESRDHEMPDSASIAAKSNGQPFHLITKVEAVAPVDPTPRLSCPPRALYRLLHEENVNTSPSAKDTDKSAQLNVPGSGGSSVSKRPRSHTLENMNDPGIHLHPSQRLGIMAPTETSVLVAVDQDTEEDEKMGQETSLYRLFMSLHRTDFDSTLSLRDAKQLLADLTDRMADWDQVLTVVPSNVMAQIFKQYAQLRSFVDKAHEEEKENEHTRASPIDILASAAESMSFKQMDMVMDKPDTIDASAEPFAFPSVRSGHRLRAYCILDKEEQEHEETERHFLFDVTTKHCKVVELPINTAASSINGRWIDSLRIGMDRSAESK